MFWEFCDIFSFRSSLVSALSWLYLTTGIKEQVTIHTDHNKSDSGSNQEPWMCEVKGLKGIVGNEGTC